MKHTPHWIAGAYEMQARVLHLINSLTYLGDPTYEYSSDEVRREIYKAISNMKVEDN